MSEFSPNTEGPYSLLSSSVPLTDSPRVQWAVLCYLAGDLGPHADVVERSLRDILGEAADDQVAIAVQYDGPEGGVRYLLLPDPDQPGVQAPIFEERVGRLDSGSPAALGAFLRWGLLCVNAQRVALVLRSHHAQDAFAPEVPASPSEAEPFSICYDDRAGTHLDTAELGRVIASVLREHEREQIELLAGDVAHMQFIELAYELEGRVEVLLSAQTRVPAAGWDYGRLLATLKRLCASERHASPQSVASALVPQLAADYARAGDDVEYTLSALDLRQLDEFSRVFDTLCVNTMQALGEGLIWRARALLLQHFDDDQEHRRRHCAYDCGSFFVLFHAALESLRSRAAQYWLLGTLKRSPFQYLAGFVQSMRRELARAGLPAAERAAWQQLLGHSDPRALAAAAEVVMRRFDAEDSAVLDRLRDGTFDGAEQASWRELDGKFAVAIERARAELSEERAVDYDRLRQSASAAARISRQSAQAAQLLLGQALPAFMLSETSPEPGMLIAVASTRPQRSEGWPRWSGVSLYRPPRLDDRMLASYQRFAFHERIHWAALLGTANLVEAHPRGLWRLVSSLLTTGGAATRRDLLRRLTGADSVVWGLRDQFRVMAPAPMVTLSLERRRRTLVSNPPAPDNRPQRREDYVLRLDSSARGAVVIEQLSRVQQQTMDRALAALETLLTSPLDVATAEASIRNIGSLLGEDILQALGIPLETERLLALSEGAGSVHLQLQIPRELMGYPWELMHHRGEWLSEKFAIGRQVYMATGQARSVPRRRAGRVRALVIGDPLLDADRRFSQLPAARDEAHQVSGMFERLHRELGEVIEFDRERDTLIGVRVTCADLRARLRDDRYDIVHFAGHGVFKPEDPEASAWLLSDGELWALEIRNTLLEHPAPPWLVYANACESAMETERRYHGNVFGLASAFINQGVAAYVAPLWPIEDLMAQQIARQFYHELLAERRTLGEALRRAKSIAHRVALPEIDASHGGRNAQSTSVGWASLVLYGDPTEELFQALGGEERPGEPERELPAGVRAPLSAAAARGALPAQVKPMPLHAPDHVLRAWVDGPSQALTRSAHVAPKAGQAALELIEEAGLLRFRYSEPGAAGGPTHRDLPGSNFGRLLADERIRRQLPARRSVTRVIGRWALDGLAEAASGLAAAYDRWEVREETLVEIARDRIEPLASLPEQDSDERALLILHGTFSNTSIPAAELGSEFAEWAHKHYRAVLGFEHWTLSKTPLENAVMLLEQLRSRAPQLLGPGRLDVIAHSRGGLVARAMGELLGSGTAIRNLIFIATPNCGTSLANPQNWGAFANALINVTGLDHAELFGKLAGLLARLAALRITDAVPGLSAQSPLAAQDASSFLGQLQQSSDKRLPTRYATVSAEFEPSWLVPNLKALWQAALSAGLDVGSDALFNRASDLVVDTDYVWCLDRMPSQSAELPTFLEAERVLVFTPPNSQLALPAGVLRQRALGVHHNNLLVQAQSRQLIRRWLSESPGMIGA